MHHIIRSALIYLALVTPPFLGLVGILEVGKGVAAPRSFGGEWQLDDASRQQAGDSCHGLVFEKQATLKVSQSGLRAEMIFADKARTKLNVTIDGSRISGSGRGHGACDERLSLDAELESAGASAAMVGTLACAGCPTAQFRAGKKPPSASP
jgi:hypothetical protein